MRWAEQRAEAASLDWVAKGVGEIRDGVSMNGRDLWIEVINLVRDSRWIRMSSSIFNRLKKWWKAEN